MANYFIVGASSGMGQQIALDLAQEGHRVFGTFCKHEVLSNIETLSYHFLDMMEDSVHTDYLPEVIDGLVYCPGSIQLKPFNRFQPSEFVDDFKLQVVGAIKVVQALLPQLKKSERASVVMFSTVAVGTGLNFHSQVATSKGAVEGLCKALAAEFAPKIRFNCIAPSLTDTPLAGMLLNSEQKKEANALRHPLKRIGTVEDISNMVTFLLSEKASWITGQNMHVDGGMSTLRV